MYGHASVFVCEECEDPGLPGADHILTQNLKGRSSSSAASIETIQPVGNRQNTRLSFSCRTNRHLFAFRKLFTRTDESSRNIWCLIHFMLWQAKTWEEIRRVQVPISKHFQTDILWTWTLSKKNNTTSNSTSHEQEVRNLAKVPYWQCTCPSPLAHLLGTFGHGNTFIPPLRAPTLQYNSSPNATCKFWWNITKNTGAGAPAVHRVYSLCVKYTLSYQSTLREKNAPFLSLHVLSAFFHKICSTVFRNMLKIQTESYFHLIVSKWPISTAKL